MLFNFMFYFGVLWADIVPQRFLFSPLYSQEAASGWLFCHNNFTFFRPFYEKQSLPFHRFIKKIPSGAQNKYKKVPWMHKANVIL